MKRKYAKGTLIEVLYDIGMIKKGTQGKIIQFDKLLGKYEISWGPGWVGWLLPVEIARPGEPEVIEYIDINIIKYSETTYQGKLRFKNRNRIHHIDYLATSPSTVCNRLMSYYKHNPLKYVTGVESV